MALELLANAFVFGSDDPARRSSVLEAMRTSHAFSSVYQDGRWCVGESAFVVGPRQPAEAAPHGLLLTQAPASLLDSPGELARLAELLAHRPERVGDVAGDVGAVRLDGPSAHLMRPAAGRVPWYYTVDATGCAAGTRLAFFHHLLGMTAMDELAHAAACAQVFPDQRTPLAGVHLLAPGHAVSLRPRVLPKPVAYWHPFAVDRTRPSDESVAEHAADLRERLVAALDRELDPDGRNLLGSGLGTGPGSLAVLAVRAAGRPITPFSLVTPDDVRLRTPESAAAQGDIGSTRLVPVTPDVCLAAQRATPRVGVAVQDQVLGQLAGFVADGWWTVLVGDDLADELMGDVRTLPYDWLASFSAVQLARGLRRGMMDRGRLAVLRMWADTRRRRWTGRPTLAVASDLPGFVPDDLRAEYAAWRAGFARRIARVGHPYPRLQAALECDGLQVVSWEVCSALGVRRSTPFATREVIELAVACHPQEHAEPPRRLERAAAGTDLPDESVRPTESPASGAQMDTGSVDWPGTLPDRLRGIVREDWLRTPPGRLSFADATSLSGLVLGTEPPVLVPARLHAEAKRDA